MTWQEQECWKLWTRVLSRPWDLEIRRLASIHHRTRVYCL